MTTATNVPKVAVHEAPRQFSLETQCLLTLGRERGWDFAVLGQAPMPTQPVQLGDWLVVPASQDQSHIPIRAWERLHAIRAAGLQPQGFVLVHETRKSLPASTQLRRPFQWSSLTPALKTVLVVAGIILALPVLAMGVAFVLAAIAAVVTSLLALLIVPAILFAGLTGLDPILVAVTNDGYWVEIDRWDV
jgi:hypothetical protein